jgi:hypothetical protein
LRNARRRINAKQRDESSSVAASVATYIPAQGTAAVAREQLSPSAHRAFNHPRAFSGDLAPSPVIAGLDPAIPINVARLCLRERDGRVEPGHDDSMGIEQA